MMANIDQRKQLPQPRSSREFSQQQREFLSTDTMSHARIHDMDGILVDGMNVTILDMMSPPVSMDAVRK